MLVRRAGSCVAMWVCLQDVMGPWFYTLVSMFGTVFVIKV